MDEDEFADQLFEKELDKNDIDEDDGILRYNYSQILWILINQRSTNYQSKRV